MTPSSSTTARRSLPLAITSSLCIPTASMASTFLKPTPSDMTWKPPLSVKVGPGQFMNRLSPPASSTMSDPGCRYRWYALASRACDPISAIASGSTAFIVAFVPTGMNAGVATSPCGVPITPVRPCLPGSRVPMVKENWAESGTPPSCQAAAFTMPLVPDETTAPLRVRERGRRNGAC